jgi:hypothetical protein
MREMSFSSDISIPNSLKVSMHVVHPDLIIPVQNRASGFDRTSLRQGLYSLGGLKKQPNLVVNGSCQKATHRSSKSRISEERDVVLPETAKKEDT